MKRPHPDKFTQDDSGIVKRKSQDGSSSVPLPVVAPSNPQQTKSLKFLGCSQFRQRLVFSTLSGTRIRIDRIRDKDENPGLRDFEASFLRLLNKFSHGSIIEINETGTSLRYVPGTLVGGAITHDTSISRSIGWYIEGLLPLFLFTKQATSLVLTGITNDNADVNVDVLRDVVLPSLGLFGVTKEACSLQVRKRGCAPAGGGEVSLSIPHVRELKPINLVDEGYVKKVSGIAFSSKVTPQMTNRIVESAKGVLLPFLPDVFLTTDAQKGASAGNSPGFGVSLYASTTSGCRYASHGATGVAQGVVDTLPELATAGTLPEDLGRLVAQQLLAEIASGGCISALLQPLVFSLMALASEDVSRVRIGELSQQGMATLRLLKTFFGITFRLKPERNDLKKIEKDAKESKKEAEAMAAKKKLHDAHNEDDDGYDDMAVGGNEKLGKSRNKKKKSELAENDEEEKAEEEEEGEQPITLDVGTGKSEQSILVSCQGIGYKNAFKKVT
jgi:RNA 3'-terminal phosphate cyclase-like protein